MRRSACNQLEKAFAAAFATYFTGDPSFVKPGDSTPGSQASLFVAAQSVQRLLYPQVAFMCIEATEVVARSNAYTAPMHLIVDTALSERPDDFPSLLALHQDRVDKCLNLFDNLPVLQGLINAPLSGSDPRQVQSFQLYGMGEIEAEMNTRENNRLCFICKRLIPFQPVG